MNDLKKILDFSSARHSHLCPRQVLGARIGLASLVIEKDTLKRISTWPWEAGLKMTQEEALELALKVVKEAR